MLVHTNKYLGSSEFFESMLYTIGNICSHTHLSLQAYISRSRIMLQVFKQMLAFIHIAMHIRIIIHHIQSYHRAIELGITHENTHIQKHISILWILYRNKNTLVILTTVFCRHLLITKHYLTSTPLGNNT